MKSQPDGSSTDFHVSLIAPAHGEAATDQMLIESIASRTRRPDEIVFIDGFDAAAPRRA
jgi:hypothetical protein